ncbi:hypothetical protein PINS_up001323 [Pythium insidiosum]|nr:hypothetical protein PINS_up001323 [Pythium insidiosum]
MEQMLSSIHERQDEGATIPEIRDILGVPTFKLPYKLAQGLISNYSLTVEQVVLGKSTMYRMFAPGVTRKDDQDVPVLDQPVQDNADEVIKQEFVSDADAEATENSNTDTVYQPSTMKEATRGLVVASTAERRRAYVLERVTKEKIVSIHHLRNGLIELERPRGKPAIEAGQIDIRSLRRILDDLETSKLLVTLDITLPPKRVLQKSHRIVKCVASPGAEQDRFAIRAFIDAYLEEQQRKLLDNFNHENDAFIVVSNRNQKKKKSDHESPEATSTVNENGAREIVPYSAMSYKLARVQLVKLHKQGRRLGMHFGILHRCRAFHLLTIERVPEIRKRREGLSSDGLEDRTATKQSPSVDHPGNVVFALKEMLDLLSVREYIQLVGVNELLSEPEENKVRMAIARGDSWDALPADAQVKIRGCEADRFSRILRVLVELGLLQIANDSSHDLLDVIRSSDDFDQVISHVAFATLSGGLFQLKERVRITIRRGNKVVKVLPNKQSYVFASGFHGKTRSEHNPGRIPLSFHLKSTDDANEYWKTLKFLSLEGARMGSRAQDNSSISVDVGEDEIVRAAPLRDYNIYAMKVWVPRSTTNYSARTERAKAVADAVGPLGSSKRKRFVSITMEHSERANKKMRRAYNEIFTAAYRGIDAGDGAVASRWRKMDALGGAKSIVRASKWSAECDGILIDAYLEKLSCQWFIDIPLALQRHGERVAFRTTKLSRTRISWKSLADRLGRKREDCILRVRELLSIPAVQARVQKTKEAITKAKNPSGVFHEEHAMISQPRLTALLIRALQIIFHEKASYYSALADVLISQWKEAEVKLVWRYLWLAGVITRTTKANEGKNQKQRGFCIHSHVHEMKSLHIPHYAIEFFCDAAEYASFLQQNVKEAEMVDDDGCAESTGAAFEQDVEPNAPPGQIAMDMAYMVEGNVVYQPEYLPPDDTVVESCGSSFSEEQKRSAAIKGLAGHLSKRCGGAVPDDFLNGFWSVKGQYRSVSALDGLDAQLNQAASITECFSVDAHKAIRWQLRGRPGNQDDVMKWVMAQIQEAGERGVSHDDLSTMYVDCFVSTTSGSKDKGYVALEVALETHIREQRVFEVNGYDTVRYVSSDCASMWTLYPYRISSESTKDKVHFVFEKNKPIVSRPWLHLDGSVNTKVSLMLKRRVVNIVMCSPGIQDRDIHCKMHSVLTLQDTRALLDELIQEEVLYGRIGRSVPSPSSVFDMPKQSRSTYELFGLLPGDLRHVCNRTDRLHYFPAVNCVEVLGAAACDADLGRTN